MVYFIGLGNSVTWSSVVWGMPLEVVCNRGYLPWTGVYCDALCEPGAVSAYCTCCMCCYMCVSCGAWSAPGAVSASCTWHMCWLYVVLGMHLVLSVIAALAMYMCCLYVCVVMLGAHLVLSVLAALGICVGYIYVWWCLECTWCCLCVDYIYRGVIGVHLGQEGSGPCKIPNLSHILWSYRTYMCFAVHVNIDPRQS